MKALIASGSGRYADPWHPFPETSPALATILADAGFDTTIDDDVDRAMTCLEDVDLLVVNAGDPWRGESSPPPPPESTDGFARALERGIGVLALHCAVASLRDYPQWAPTIGGMWVPGLSWHPPISNVEVQVLAMPDGAPMQNFALWDERYSRLQALGERTIVADFDVDGERLPAAWVRTCDRARVAVDVLGHDTRSYEAPGHRELVARLARWAAT